jgi:GNAT superfamily N-acetyltransferase
MHLVPRRGIDSDAETTAELYLRARKAARPAIPAMVHTDEETRRWIARRVVPQTEPWIAAIHDGAVVGMLVLDDDWVDQLYVEPGLTGQGIGGELIALAKRERPNGLRLWTFESNLAAQRFYERHGFDARDRTADDNEEGRARDPLRLGWPTKLTTVLDEDWSPGPRDGGGLRGRRLRAQQQGLSRLGAGTATTRLPFPARA